MDATQTAALLRQWDNLLILTHLRPDGDTVGCAAGLCLALRQLGMRAYVLHNEEATPVIASYIAGLEPPDGWQPEFVVSVDVATLDLFPQSAAGWKGQIDLAIDHHQSHTGFGKSTCLDASCAACGELVYDICLALGPVTPEVALPLYAAVSTDTGCFVYGNTTARTHRVAAALMETGIPYREVNKAHFRTKSLKRLQLESILMQGMDLHQGGTIAVGSLSLADMAQVGAGEADAEDIAAFLGQIEGVSVSVTIRELKPGECKISLRTNPTLLNATDVCALLGGGGHDAAAGCTVAGTVRETRAAILRAIEVVQAQTSA
ncbi:MAG: DHH family phosphoesterase [Oscillospiraceae bacterium]|nr:DHH family phosphoesterase [Oscillospiraceae bacterium]